MLLARLSSDTRLIEQTFNMAAARQLQAFFTLALGLAIGLSASWQISLVVLASFPINIAASAIQMQIVAGATDAEEDEEGGGAGGAGGAGGGADGTGSGEGEAARQKRMKDKAKAKKKKQKEENKKKNKNHQGGDTTISTTPATNNAAGGGGSRSSAITTSSNRNSSGAKEGSGVVSGSPASIIATAFTHMRTVCAFSMQHRIAAHYAALTRQRSQQRVGRNLFLGVAFGGSNCALFCTYALLFWFGSTLLEDGEVGGWVGR